MLHCPYVPRLNKNMVVIFITMATPNKQISHTFSTTGNGNKKYTTRLCVKISEMSQKPRKVRRNSAKSKSKCDIIKHSSDFCPVERENHKICKPKSKKPTQNINSMINFYENIPSNTRIVRFLSFFVFQFYNDFLRNSHRKQYLQFSNFRLWWHSPFTRLCLFREDAIASKDPLWFERSIGAKGSFKAIVTL